MKQLMAVCTFASVVALACNGSSNTLNLPNPFSATPISATTGPAGPAHAQAPIGTPTSAAVSRVQHTATAQPVKATPAPAGYVHIDAAHSPVSPAIPHEPRNVGTQIWFNPVPAGDELKLVQHPELWSQAASRVDVVSLYQAQAIWYRGFNCGLPCGPNDYQSMVNAVPGGAFQWFNNHGFTLAFEGSSVKEYACTPEYIQKRAIEPALNALDNVAKSGGHVSYISLDEPFTSGVAGPDRDPFGNGFKGCNLSMAQVAQLQRQFNDGVHAKYPDVGIGIIEPYPFFSVDELASAMLELEHEGVIPAYFHLDFDLPRAVRENQHWPEDLRRIRELFAAKGIPFGIIVVGGDGSSNAAYMLGAATELRAVNQAVGLTEHTLTQSWADNPDAPDTTSSKNVPDTVPETEPGTHTWFVLQIIRYLGIQPAHP